MSEHPHDEFFKYLFSMITVSRAFFEKFLPPRLASQFDFETLTPDETEYVTPELASLYSDKVFQCRFRGSSQSAALVLLLEHKSFVPKYPHFQLGKYRQCIWDTQVGNKKVPTPVLPVVLYHGKQHWKAKPMAEYFDEMPGVLKPFIGGFDYVLADLSGVSDKELVGLKVSYLAYGLLTMKHAKDKEWLQAQMFILFEKGDEFLQTDEGRRFVHRLFVYFSRISEISGENLKKAVIKNMSSKMKDTFISTYDQILLEGQAIGESIGEKRGEKRGETKQALFMVKNLLATFPQLTDEEISKLSGAKTAQVKKLRADADGEKKKGEDK